MAAAKEITEDVKLSRIRVIEPTKTNTTMKKIFALVLGLVAMAGVASAQNYMVVDSEKIFKSINDYNNAMTQLDQMAKSYQQQIDSKFGRYR